MLQADDLGYMLAETIFGDINESWITLPPLMPLTSARNYGALKAFSQYQCIVHNSSHGSFKCDPTIHLEAVT